MRYIDEFLSFKCSGDILHVVAPINQGGKEITEAMGVRSVLRDLTLPEPMKYTLIDLCAGNALVGVISAFTLPIKTVIAYDHDPRKLRLEYIQRFEYRKANILKDEINIPEDSIICAVHPCKDLAEKAIQIYKENKNAKALVIMPCCSNPKFKNKLKIEDIEYLESSLMDSYKKWCWYLSRLADGRMFVDNDVESEKNVIITANKNVRMIKNFDSSYVKDNIRNMDGGK